jgi:hypothetical protein
MKRNRLSLLFLLIPLFFVGVASATSYPLYIQNTTNTLSTTQNITFTQMYYPVKLYTNAEANTLYNLMNGGNNISISANTILTSNLTRCDNLVINSGVSLTTNGFIIVCSGTITNDGFILGGNLNDGGRLNPFNFNSSYGGSGGGGGGNGGTGGNGGSTLVSGGSGGTGGGGSSGSTPSSPTLTQSLVQKIANDTEVYLTGAGGGFGYSASPYTASSAVFGIYIQANTINNNGIISTNGVSGNPIGGGGSGGGAVLLSYKTNLISGTITTNGGNGSPAVYGGGSGGSGLTLTYQYTTQPIPSQPLLIPIYLNVSNFSYIPKLNQITSFQTYTVQQITSNILINQITLNFMLNMTDMNGQLTFNSLCNTLIQDTPNCALFPYAANTFISKPSSWYIQSDTGLSTYNGTGSKSNFIQFSNNNVTFTPKIILNYNQFSPTYSFQLNLTNNPKMQNSITQQPLTFVLSNTLLTGRRNLANFSIFSQDNFNALNDVNLSLRMSGLFNGYVISKTISNTTANASGKYFLSIPKSNYLNPNILLNLNASVTKPLFYQQADTYCQANISDTQTNVYPIGLVDTNGSKYSMYVYSNGGNSAAGYLLEVLEQKGVGSTLVQSLTIPPSIPFPLPLESVGQQYAFDVYSPNCKTVLFKGAFSQPSNPTYITLSSLVPVYIVNKSAAVGSCKLNGYVNGLDNISCFGADSTNLAYEYSLKIYKSTTAAAITQLVFSGNYSGNSFTANVLLPENTIYIGTITSLYNDANNTPLILYSGQIVAHIIQLTAPLFGLIAFILFITVVLGGVATGKAIVIVIFADLGMFIISMLNLVQIPLTVVVVFVILGGIAIWWDKA